MKFPHNCLQDISLANNNENMETAGDNPDVPELVYDSDTENRDSGGKTTLI